eukprot:s1371_g8.t1
MIELCPNEACSLRSYEKSSAEPNVSSTLRIGGDLWPYVDDASQMYHLPDPTGAFLVADLAFMEEHQLLRDLVRQLEEALPMLGHFCDVAAAKALGEGARRTVPASGAEVTMLLWLVPSDESPALYFPGSKTTVSYAANRAVFWRDDCASTTPEWLPDRSWTQGYLQRRVHLLLRWSKTCRIWPWCEQQGKLLLSELRWLPGPGPRRAAPVAAAAASMMMAPAAFADEIGDAAKEAWGCFQTLLPRKWTGTVAFSCRTWQVSALASFENHSQDDRNGCSYRPKLLKEAAEAHHKAFQSMMLEK